MALKITQKRETFLVEGTINANTALNFKNHIEFAMKGHEDLVIDINNVTEIDRNGMKAMQSIYNTALIYNIKFFVVGIGCKEVYDDLYINNAA